MKYEIHTVTPDELEVRLAPLEARLAALEAAQQPEPDPPPDPNVGPEDVQEAILDGQHVILDPSKEYAPFYVITGTRVTGNGAPVTGARPWSDGWEKRGEHYYKPWTVPFHQHEAKQVHTNDDGKPSARGLAHRAAMLPHMITADGKVLQPAYKASDLGRGRFYLEGTAASPKGIWAMFERDPKQMGIKASFHQRLVYTKTADVDGVELDGVTFREAANTGTQGALDMPPESDNWIVRDCNFILNSSEGARVRGRNHIFDRCAFNWNGHVGLAGHGMSDCVFTDCQTNSNVWRIGIDPLWHAGGFKGQYSCNNNQFLRFTSKNNNGAGFWLDIWNLGNTLDGFLLEGNMAFGCHIEHHTQNGAVRNGIIRGTRKFSGVGSGLQIQGKVLGYEFVNLELEENEDGAVYYKKEKDPRGDSGGNHFENIQYLGRGNGNNDRWVIQGDPAKMPDTYVRMAMPSFTIYR